MTSEKCPMCLVVEEDIPLESAAKRLKTSTGNLAQSMLRRTYCLTLTSNQVVHWLKKRYHETTDLSKTTDKALLITPEDVLDKIITSIFDEDLYDQFHPCLGQYISQLDSIASFVVGNVNCALQGKEINKTVSFNLTFDSVLSMLVLKTVENNKSITIGGKYLLSLPKTPQQSKSMDTTTTPNKLLISTSEELAKKQKRMRYILDFIDNGSDDFSIVKDDNSFVTDKEFNDAFAKAQSKKRFKGYAIRQGDATLLNTKGFAWKNVLLCSDCANSRNKTCKCEKPKLKISIIEKMRLIVKDPLIIPPKPQNVSVQLTDDIIQLLDDTKSFSSSSSLSSHSINSSEEESSSHEEEEKEAKEVVVVASSSQSPFKYKCTHPGCTYENEDRELLKKHGKRVNKEGIQHMTKETVAKVYPPRAQASKKASLCSISTSF